MNSDVSLVFENVILDFIGYKTGNKFIFDQSSLFGGLNIVYIHVLTNFM